MHINGINPTPTFKKKSIMITEYKTNVQVFKKKTTDNLSLILQKLRFYGLIEAFGKKNSTHNSGLIQNTELA